MASVLAHLGLLILLIAPAAIGDEIERLAQGGGGAGPAGGGGGGNRGGGGALVERLRFIRIAAPPPPPVEVARPVPRPTLVQPLTPKLELVVPPAEALSTAPIAGTGGTGADNTAGQGPGSGGGTGTGIGTGTGSAVGSGTGGGRQENYPPTPYEIPLPPMPVPNSLKGDSVIAEFDVDETGRVLSMKFTETSDRGYNRKLSELLRSFKFRPGTTPDGRPVRMKAQVVYQF